MNQPARHPLNRNPVVDATLIWWRSLYPDPAHHYRGDAGTRASLRRAPSPMEVMMQPGFHALLGQIQDKTDNSLSQHVIRRLALIVPALCELRKPELSSLTFARALGSKASKDQPPLMSPMRFQSLMAAMVREEDSDALTALRRANAMLKDTGFNIGRFAEDILHFDDSARIRWTFDYHGTSRESTPRLQTPSLSKIEESV